MALSGQWYRQRTADIDASWRYVAPPLTSASLDFSDLRLRTVRLSHELTAAEFRQLAAALETLFLDDQKQVARLPSFRRAASLRRVWLAVMRGLSDLAPLAEAPGLEALLLIDWRHASPEIVRPFVGHPNLRYADLGLGSLRKYAAAHAILPLPEAPDGLFHVLGPPE